jgi:Ser/Thr protein kinase RdoA (MazF antagonist)
LLRAAFDRLCAELDERPFAERVLHGEPHRDNVLATATGFRWIDFEEVSIGPLEWDLTSLPSGSEEEFPQVDRELLRLLRTLNSARVATWCWVCADIEGMRSHGEFHLERVRRATATRTRGA